MSKSFEEILVSRRKSNSLTRLSISSINNTDGIITVYDTRTGCVKLIDSDEARCLNLLLDHSEGVRTKAEEMTK